METIGSTPCVHLRRISPQGTAIYAKVEAFNPSGSAADRIAVGLVADAEADGYLRPAGTIIEATLGNMGIALAQACAGRGYKVIACMPESMSLEKRALLRLWGAQLELTAADGHLDGARARANELATKIPDAWLMPQWDLEAVASLHAKTTGAELVEHVRQDGGRIDAFAGCIGTGGTLMGVSMALRAAFPAVEIVAAIPAAPGPHRLQGVAAREEALGVARPLKASVEDVAARDAWAIKERLGREEGMLVGISSGAAVLAAMRVAARIGPGARVYTLLWDTGERYFSLAEAFK